MRKEMPSRVAGRYILVPRARRFLVTWLGNGGLWKQPVGYKLSRVALGTRIPADTNQVGGTFCRQPATFDNRAKTDTRGRGLNEAHVTDLLVFQQGVKGQSKSYQEQQKYQEKLRECIHYTGKHHNVYSKPGKLSYEEHQGHPGTEN